MSEPKTLASGFSYVVRGKLSRLPKGHKIWCLTNDENTGRVWHQSFEDPRYYEETKMWEGRVSGSRKSRLAIFAVVVPPSTQDYFRYFQRLGELRRYQFEPLPRVPPEFRVNSEDQPARGVQTECGADTSAFAAHVIPESGGRWMCIGLEICVALPRQSVLLRFLFNVSASRQVPSVGRSVNTLSRSHGSCSLLV